MSRFTRIDSGVTSRGNPWQVGTIGDRLVILYDRVTIGIEGAEREKFAEAVARAVTPGQPGAIPHVVTDQASHRRNGCPTCLDTAMPGQAVDGG